MSIVSGTSGARKLTLCEQLFQKEKDCIVWESDLLWDERFNTPQDNFEYRRLWMRMRVNITQIHCWDAVCDESELFHWAVWLKSLVDSNHWPKKNGKDTKRGMTLIDTTHLTPQQAAEQADRWIHDRLEKRKA